MLQSDCAADMKQRQRIPLRTRFQLLTTPTLHARLLQGDFASNMKLLQRFPPVDVHVILGRAEALRSMKPVIILE